MDVDIKNQIKKQTIILEDWKNNLKCNLSKNLNKEKFKINIYIIEKNWMEKYTDEILSSSLNGSIDKVLKFKTFPIINHSSIYNAKEGYLYPNSEFVILNKEAWYSLMIETKIILNLKLDGVFYNKKLLFNIGNWNYYFYYLESNEIKKGYISFNVIDKNVTNEILNDLERFEINEFIEKFLNKTKPIFNDANKILKYKANNFELILKDQKSIIDKNQKNLYKKIVIIYSHQTIRNMSLLIQ